MMRLTVDVFDPAKKRGQLMPLCERAAYLVRLLDEGRALPEREVREVLSEIASTALVRVERHQDFVARASEVVRQLKREAAS